MYERTRFTHPSNQHIRDDNLAPNPCRPLVSTLQHPLVDNIVRLSAVEDTLQALHPLLSLTQVRARVSRIVDETPDTKTFVLQPNTLWAGFQAGQYVRISLEINGRRVHRLYSLSGPLPAHASWPSPSSARRLGWCLHLHDHTRVGDVLTLSQADGDFVLPGALPAWPDKILLLSAGSGLRPVMAMLRDRRAATRATSCLCMCAASTKRSPSPTPCSAWQPTCPTCAWLPTSRKTVAASPAEQLQAAVPNLGQRSTWVCGPQGLMDAVHALWRSGLCRTAGLGTLHSRTAVARLCTRCAGNGDAGQKRHHVHDGWCRPLAGAGRERGLIPQTRLPHRHLPLVPVHQRSGTVENLQTGEISSTPDEPIRLCISVAQ